MARRKKLPVVYVVSDGRGETAAQVLTAAAVQFEGSRYRVEKRARVRTVSRVESVVRQAARAKAPVFYTLVSSESRAAMRKIAGELHVPSIDILGPAFTALHDLFHAERGATPGLLYQLDRERIDRMDAIDYTLKHDDGQRPADLADADVVLVGVSRASKSTTCFYLAYEGIRAANVPLLPDVPPPDELLELPPEKVIGLRIELTRLLIVREGRAANLGLGESSQYLQRRSVATELATANRLMDAHGWRSVNVSYLAVEEIAREIMRLIAEPDHEG